MGIPKGAKGVQMKRFFFYGIAALFSISCAVSTISIRPDSKEDLVALKGEWEGTAEVAEGGYFVSLPVHLRIANENLEGLIVFDQSSTRTYSFLGSVSQPGSARADEAGHSRIEDGKLLLFWENFRWARLAFDQSKTRLKGDIRWHQAAGSLFLQKTGQR